jgi:hypothetical protein
MKRKRSVYVMGPLNTGMTTVNIHAAFQAVTELMAAGYEWFCPHLNLLYEAGNPLSYEQAMAHDLYWLDKCDVGLRIHGPSRGTDQEYAFCVKANKLVYSSVAELMAHESPEIDDAPQA